MDPESCLLPKPIYVLSDCTGESAANTVRAALGQFEQCMDLSMPANLRIHSFLSKEKEVYNICRGAAQEGALLVYTLVEPKMVEAVSVASKLYGVEAVDIWTPLLDKMEAHLHVSRVAIPLGRRAKGAHKLSTDYYKMIEAVEYTRKQDDGAMPENWHEADLLIVAVSRCGKTPLSIYLGQRGFKVANLPLVPGVPPPKQLFEIAQERIVALTIEPAVLHDIRSRRMRDLGVGSSASYDKIRQVRSELKEAQDLYAANPTWPVLDVTHTGVEETAARVMRIMADRERERRAAAGAGKQELFPELVSVIDDGPREPVKPHFDPQDVVWRRLGEWG